MTSCVLCSGKSRSGGYGLKSYKGRLYRAHRLAYALHHGLEPQTMGGVVMHSCDNRLCVNPDHLSLGTHEANMADMVSKGRQAQGTTHGRALLDQTTVDLFRRRYVPRCRLNGCRALAREFGLDASVVSEAIRGKTYK